MMSAAYLKSLLILFLLSAGTLFPQWDREKTLDEILYHRKKAQEKIDDRTKFTDETLCRPRGASLDGRYVIFERRRYSDIYEFYFIIFDTKENTRTLIRIPSLYDREETLKELKEKYEFLEKTINDIRIVDDREFETDRHLKYNYVFDCDRVNCYLQIYREHMNRRVVMANYPLTGSWVRPPWISRAYSYFNGGFAVKISLRSYTENNRIRYIEDILCFSEHHLQDGPLRIVKIEEEYLLNPAQKNILFLTDFEYDVLQDLTAKTEYFLGGKLKRQEP